MSDNQEQLVHDWLRGDADAIAFINILAGVSQVWDDLIDRDRTPSADEINGAFVALLLRLPRNGFYRQYFDELQPLIEAAMLDWLTANELERGGQQDAMVAFVLRDSMAGILLRAMAIIGGWDYAVSRAPDVRRHIHDEPLSDYSRRGDDGQP